MYTPEEKAAFALRLRNSLKKVSAGVDTPAKLALQFSLRHSSEPITSQAAHKWLSGKAIPSKDKIATLAKWLNVSEHWLRFGAPENTDSAPPQSRHASSTSGLSENDIIFVAVYRQLTDAQKQILQAVANEFAISSARQSQTRKK